MALLNIDAATDALEDLLDFERGLILEGKIDALLRMGREKEKLLARLASTNRDSVVLDRLRRKAERNQALLASAARGVKAAVRRIDAMKTGVDALRTYGRNGEASDLSPSAPGMNLRA